MTSSIEQGSASVEELLALLRDLRTSTASIAEELSAVNQSAPTAAQLEVARQVVTAPAANDATRVAALPLELAVATLRAMAEAGRLDILRGVAETGGKTVAKEAKRELQRLRSRGVDVGEVARSGAPLVKPPPPVPEPASYVSSLDGFGERAVWFARLLPGGIAVVQAIVSDTRGLVQVDVLSLGRRSYRAFAASLPSGGPVLCAEVTRDHARILIAEALAKTETLGLALPRGYTSATGILGSLPEKVASPARERFADAAATLEEGASVLEHPLFSSWIPDEDSLRQVATRVDEIAVSQLYIDEVQREQAVEEAVTKAAENYFTMEHRRLYAGRLFEQAFVLAANQLTDVAARAVAVARALESDASWSSIPFTRALFARPFAKSVAPHEPSSEAPSSLLVAP